MEGEASWQENPLILSTNSLLYYHLTDTRREMPTPATSVRAATATATSVRIGAQSYAVLQNLRIPNAIALLNKWNISRSSYNELEDAGSGSSSSGGSSTISSSSSSTNSNSNSYRNSDFDSFRTTSGSPDGLEAASAPVRNIQMDIGVVSDSAISASAGIVTTGEEHDLAACFLRMIARSVYALNGGVKRAHLIAPNRGALLKELYTRDGAGLLISRDVYEGVRLAQPSDVRAVEEIIRPLEKEGILVPRSRDQLEKEINSQNCFLLKRDSATLACCMMQRYSDTQAEVYCLAVHPSYRRGGRGETLLAYLERRALTIGITQLFILSTRTMQWFEERGFKSCSPSVLPAARAYDPSRGSKVYIKNLGSQRDIDAEELLWNIME